MKKILAAALIVLCFSAHPVAGQTAWRQATGDELTGIILKHSVVARDRIPTEFRTASGITDGEGKFIAGVMVNTADFDSVLSRSYSHLFITQAPIKIGGKTLRPGEYTFGYRRLDNASMEVSFYEAAMPSHVVLKVKAKLDTKRVGVRSFRIALPVDGKGSMQFGRFVFGYQLSN